MSHLSLVKRIARSLRWRATHEATRQTRPRARWGNLRRTEPFSDNYGYDRGGCLDRVLIERFLERHRTDIRGTVLEVRTDAYARRFGRHVDQVEVLDIDEKNPRATIVADLCADGALEGRVFDCIVLTQVLQYTQDPLAALSNVCNALAPGGTALITVPMVQRVAPAIEGPDYWRFTPDGLSRLVELATRDAETEVAAAGNLVTSVASLLGLGQWDVKSDSYPTADPRFGSIVCARVGYPRRRMMPSLAGIVTELTLLPSLSEGSCVPLSFLNVPLSSIV
jgi:SAM-dependent methyltransferase